MIDLIGRTDKGEAEVPGEGIDKSRFAELPDWLTAREVALWLRKPISAIYDWGANGSNSMQACGSVVPFQQGSSNRLVATKLYGGEDTGNMPRIDNREKHEERNGEMTAEIAMTER
ncbi:MAG: hypothetical protein L0220_04455 [Acidobacteria bacterium]|nr:hypothetical protein [Acidobacteriota bacterium]